MSAASFGRFALPNKKALCLLIGYGRDLVSVGTDPLRVSFFDFCRASSSSSSSSGGALLMGSYVDAHTDDVTCVCFAAPAGGGGGTVFMSASKDGLIVVHDPTMPAKERVLISVLNVKSPVREVGFFGSMVRGAVRINGK